MNRSIKLKQNPRHDGEGDWQKSSYELHILNEGEDDEKCAGGRLLKTRTQH